MLRLGSCGLILCSLLLVGCSESGGPAGVPLKGTITLDGQPMSGATITLIPTGATPGSGGVALSNDSGEFQVKTFEGKDGVAPGDYKVAVSKFVNPDGTTFVATPEQAPIDSGARESVPQAYTDPDQTLLTANVPAAGGEIKLELKSRP